jgi:ketosteroid isomerase-like protein
MSQQNVEIIKWGIDAFNRRDVDALLDLATADIEWFPALGMAVEGGSFRGREGVEEYLHELHDTWEEQRLLPEEFRDLGDSVLWLGRTAGHGRGSGVPVDAPMGGIYDFRDGKVSRVRMFFDRREAMRAAGLSE